jgi:polyphosphate kinase
VAGHFEKEIFPVLTPLAVDARHPFPHISHLSLSLLVVVRDGGERRARLKVPEAALLPRLVPVPAGPAQGGSPDGRHPPLCFVWLEQVIIAHLPELFQGVEIVSAHPFRITRNADIDFDLDDETTDDLLESIDVKVRQRSFEFITRLSFDQSMPPALAGWLLDQLNREQAERRAAEGQNGNATNPAPLIGEIDLYWLDGPLGLEALMSLMAIDRPDLKDPPFTPRIPACLANGQDLFRVLREREVLLHHPYDSFEPVVDLIRAAARDRNVLAIKQTLYRVGRNSPVVHALMEAREEDTQVAVLVELQARLDEENNIIWARQLEQAGVHRSYGLPGLKTHCKVTLLVRREAEGMQRYLHLGTGNYNVSTARLYTDLGLLTTRDSLGRDASDLFNYLTGISRKREYRELLVAPVSLRQRLRELIEREIEHARRGEEARLVFKMNQLTDGPMIALLYEASRVGVQIELIVRGICCLRPGLPGISDNIRIISIVGRFLEHSRIYYFRNGGQEEVYLGSADLMPRNLDRRVEAVFPVATPALRDYIRDVILATQLRDTVKARQLQPDGSYVRVRPAPGAAPLDSQTWFLAHAAAGEGAS